MQAASEIANIYLSEFDTFVLNLLWNSVQKYFRYIDDGLLLVSARSGAEGDITTL